MLQIHPCLVHTNHLTVLFVGGREDWSNNGFVFPLAKVYKWLLFGFVASPAGAWGAWGIARCSGHREPSKERAMFMTAAWRIIPGWSKWLVTIIFRPFGRATTQAFGDLLTMDINHLQFLGWYLDDPPSGPRWTDEISCHLSSVPMTDPLDVCLSTH